MGRATPRLHGQRNSAGMSSGSVSVDRPDAELGTAARSRESTGSICIAAMPGRNGGQRRPRAVLVIAGNGSRGLPGARRMPIAQERPTAAASVTVRISADQSHGRILS